ncbi:glycosyltransferase [Pseudomonas sp. 14A]|nr:glycosyltransferase [Pseudomonas sp. 14A]
MLSLVVPVYRNEGSLPDLLSAIDLMNDQLLGDLEVVFVVDGSPDNCYELLRQDLPNRKFRSQLILLSRNFGSFMAIRTGFQFASGERFAVMAADLQEPPELISSMNSLLITQNFDIVVGVRDGRDDPFMSRTASRIFWGLYRRYVVPEIPLGGIDIFACNKPFRDTQNLAIAAAKGLGFQTYQWQFYFGRQGPWMSLTTYQLGVILISVFIAFSLFMHFSKNCQFNKILETESREGRH